MLLETKYPNEISKSFNISIEYKVYFGDMVDTAIALKPHYQDDMDALVELLSNLAQDKADKDREAKNVFGNIEDPTQLARLAKAGFNKEFIAKAKGTRQYVTLGVAGILLYNTSDVVAAPMLRIFTEPKSYYKPRPPFWKWYYIPLPGVFDFDKYDLNIGLTSTTSTEKDGKGEKANYLLVGLSYEINRSALFNFGYATAIKDKGGANNQLYLGITVDQNFMKDLGIFK